MARSPSRLKAGSTSLRADSRGGSALQAMEADNLAMRGHVRGLHRKPPAKNERMPMMPNRDVHPSFLLVSCSKMKCKVCLANLSRHRIAIQRAPEIWLQALAVSRVDPEVRSAGAGSTPVVCVCVCLLGNSTLGKRGDKSMVAAGRRSNGLAKACIELDNAT